MTYTDEQRNEWIDKQIAKDEAASKVKAIRDEMESAIEKMQTEINNYRALKETEINELLSS